MKTACGNGYHIRQAWRRVGLTIMIVAPGQDRAILLQRDIVRITGGNGEDEDDEGLAGVVEVEAPEGDEGEPGGLEHEFRAQEHDDEVAPGEEADNAHGEHQGADIQDSDRNLE